MSTLTTLVCDEVNTLICVSSALWVDDMVADGVLTLDGIWAVCHRPDWMFWVLYKKDMLTTEIITLAMDVIAEDEACELYMERIHQNRSDEWVKRKTRRRGASKPVFLTHYCWGWVTQETSDRLCGLLREMHPLWP